MGHPRPVTHVLQFAFCILHFAIAVWRRFHAGPNAKCKMSGEGGALSFRNRTLALMALLLSTSSALAGDDDTRLQAEAAFREGTQLAAKAPDKARHAFARAAALYEQLRQEGAANAELFTNQGNAYLLADDLPRAILAYRRGLRLQPNDLTLQRNLAHAREEVKYAPPGTLGRPPIDHRPPWLPRLPEWSVWLVFGLYAAGCFAGVRWWMVRRGVWLGGGITAFVLASLLAAGVVYEQWDDQRERERPLVVVADDGVLLRGGNGLTYPARFSTPLNRGVEARLLHDRGAWMHIELAGGEVGWVPAKYLLVDQ